VVEYLFYKNEGLICRLRFKGGNKISKDRKSKNYLLGTNYLPHDWHLDLEDVNVCQLEGGIAKSKFTDTFSKMQSLWKRPVHVIPIKE